MTNEYFSLSEKKKKEKTVGSRSVDYKRIHTAEETEVSTLLRDQAVPGSSGLYSESHKLSLLVGGTSKPGQSSPTNKKKTFI